LDLHMSKPCFWACFYFFSFSSFCIAHIILSIFAKTIGENGLYLIDGWMDGMILCNFQCGTRHVYVECTWSWSWEHKKFLTWITKFDKAQNKDKLHNHKVLHDAQTLALVGIYINMRKQAIAFLILWKEIPTTLQGRAWFHSSNHITLVNYLDSMGYL
jgi:hypothetical protein